MRTVNCIKMGKQAEGLDKSPWPGALGDKIFENVSKEAWKEWLGQQTILINENNYSPINPEHKALLTAAMETWFFGESSD